MGFTIGHSVSPAATLADTVVVGSAPMPNNKNSLETLYAEHQQPLRRFVSRRLPQAEEAEDVVQETFLRLAAENSAPAKAFARAHSPVAYLYRMACNLAVDKLRRAASRVEQATVPESEVAHSAASDCDDTPGDALIRQRRLQALEQAVRRLPPKRRQVLVLHKFRQLTYREIAAHLDISLGMVEKHMSQALAQLDRELGGSQDAH